MMFFISRQLSFVNKLFCCYFSLPLVDTATHNSVCYIGLMSHLPHSPFQPIVVRLFIKRCPAKRSLIVWRIRVNRRMKTRPVNGGVFSCTI